MPGLEEAVPKVEGRLRVCRSRLRQNWRFSPWRTGLDPYQ